MKTSIHLLAGVFLIVAWHTLLVTVSMAQGIAYVEAPEQGNGACFADNPDQGFECARKKCMESGAEARDCLRVKWCYPAGWSVDVFMQHKEGPHWHQVTCGWQSRADAEAAANIACEGSMKEHLIECAIARIWTPEGKEIDPFEE